MPFLLSLPIAAPAMSGPIDVAALDRAIERSERGMVLPVFAGEAPHPAETGQALELVQLELEDRQRALDERRRLETIRQQAIDLKRQYFLSRCASGKKPK